MLVMQKKAVEQGIRFLEMNGFLSLKESTQPNPTAFIQVILVI